MPTQTFERDGLRFTLTLQVLPASTCQSAHDQGAERICWFLMFVQDGANPAADRLLQVSENISLDFELDKASLEKEIAVHRDRMVKQALDEADCIRQSRALEANAQSRIDDIFAKPRS